MTTDEVFEPLPPSRIVFSDSALESTVAYEGWDGTLAGAVDAYLFCLDCGVEPPAWVERPFRAALSTIVWHHYHDPNSTPGKLAKDLGIAKTAERHTLPDLSQPITRGEDGDWGYFQMCCLWMDENGLSPDNDGAIKAAVNAFLDRDEEHHEDDETYRNARSRYNREGWSTSA